MRAGASAQHHRPQPDAVVALSLDDALRMAQAQSPTIELARAGVTRATGSAYQVRSQIAATQRHRRLYQNAQVAVLEPGRPTPVTPSTDRSQSQSLCTPLIPANATDGQRHAALAQAATCSSSTGGGLRSEQDELWRGEPVRVSASTSLRTSTPAGESRRRTTPLMHSFARRTSKSQRSARRRRSTLRRRTTTRCLPTSSSTIADSSVAETRRVLIADAACRDRSAMRRSTTCSARR